MNGLKFKLIVPIVCMFLVITVFFSWQIMYTLSTSAKVEHVHNTSLAVLTNADELKLSVVQVQQWLTDISATKGEDGLNDGFDLAEEFSKRIGELTRELKQLAPEKREKIESIEKAFAPYYEAGKKMAKNYIEGGTSRGNEIMGEFDATAEVINRSVDEFKKSSYEEFEAEIRNIEHNARMSVTVAVAAVASGAVITLLVLLFVSRAVLRPVLSVLSKLEELADNEGDLTQKIAVTSRDEIGRLADTTNKVLENFRDIIMVIKEKSADLEGITDRVNVSMEDLEGSSRDISEFAREVSVGMQETAVSFEEVNRTSSHIMGDIEKFADKAQAGAERAREINRGSGELRSNAKLSRENTQRVYESTQEKLKEVVSESKSVEKINELSDAILNIAGQTNLLALNASIEAARAGEAGRGFAVVADSIRTLAEDSEQSANEIQAIAKTVVLSIKKLTQSAESILEYIHGEVLKDYDELIETSDAYSDGSQYLDELLNDFDRASRALLVTVGEMTHSISKTTVTVDRNTVQTSNIAEKTNHIARLTDVVSGLTKDARLEASELNDLVAKYRV